MKYKVGDQVVVYIATIDKRIRIVSPDYPKGNKKIFPIVAIDPRLQTYMLIVEDDMVGWQVSTFHTKVMKVSDKFLGKKFYETTEAMIASKK